MKNNLNMPSEPLVSIIIPCYNAEKYIGQTNESIFNQTYKNFEILVINDGSTDESMEIIKKYQQLDARIKYIDQSNKGVANARNKGIEESKGNIIAFLDADDAWEPENLEVKVKILLSDPNLFWVFSD